jgi:bifunctional non-homologous end joining protein LigD
MPLKEYRRKRSFDRTQEPKGKLKSSPGRAYLIQKHDASRLHYDLRLELDGVLKSWAVPKGPSLNPREKRLAVEVEDHPVDYGSFEGVIPQGEYGGGAVMLWDRGEWKPEGDANQGLRSGRLKFTLHGDRLRGGWMLVRLRGDQKRGAKPNWLLIKEQDDFANEGSADVLEEYDVSVVSGRSMSEIHSGKSTGARKRSQAKAMKVRRSVTRSASARKRTVPALPSLHPQAQLATLVAAHPKGTNGCTKSSSMDIACSRASMAAKCAGSAAMASIGRND